MKCKKCGEENKKDANFCINCGANLKEEVKEKNQSLANNTFKQIEGVFKSPYKTMKSFIKDDNYMIGLIFMAMNIVILALCSVGLLKHFSKMVTNSFGYHNMHNAFNAYSTSLDISYLKVFLLVIIIGVLSYGIFGGMTYLINTYLFKDKPNYKKISAWLGINSLVKTVAYIVLLIISLASLKLGIIIYLTFAIFYIYNLFTSFKHVSNVDDNHKGYVITLSLLTTIIIVVFILPAIFY